MKLKLYSIAAFCFFIASASAQAKNWERLPDGRVVIEVKDEKLALTTTEYDLNSIEFRVSADAKKRISPDGGRVTLGKVLANPDAAREVFAEGKVDAVRVVPPSWRHREGPSGAMKLVPNNHIPLAQGKFDPKTLAGAGGGWRTGYIWFSNTRMWGNPESGKSWALQPCDFGLGNGRVLISEKDDLGYYVVGPNVTTPMKYCLPADKRAFKTPRELRIECSPAIGRKGVRACTAWFYGAERSLEVGYDFSDKDFPQSDWRDLDGRMHAFYRHIIQSQELE